MRNEKNIGLAIFSVIAISAMSIIALLINWVNVNAAIQVGTGSVVWTWAFDTSIMWDETYSWSWSASGSINWIVVKAKIEPQIDMSISAHEINLGVLTSATASTGALDLEVWTNAVNWLLVTVRSNSGWLQNTSSWAIKLNNVPANPYQSNYNFKSTNQNSWWAVDSTISGFAVSTTLTTTEVLDNTTEHVLYQTNKPEDFDNATKDFVFEVSATPNSMAPAWNYEDILTFTITGNF